MTSVNDSIVLPCGVELKNRLVKAATTEGLANSFGNPTPELINLYENFSKQSDVGMIFSGNVQVDRRYLERPGNVIIDLDYGELSNEQKGTFSQLASAGKSGGSKFLLQVGHAGRQSTGLVCKTSVGPSNVASKAIGVGLVPCVEASKEYLMRVKEKFVYAAKVMEETGFDGIQLHSAHGYLFSSFLSPLANVRTDEFGGSVENRARMLLQTVSEIKEQRRNKEFIICVKLNSSDFQKGGMTAEEAAQVAKLLAKEGVDVLELSGGNYESPALISGNLKGEEKFKQNSTKKREAFFLEFANEISRMLEVEGLKSMTVMVTGGFRTRSRMDEAIKEKACELIGIGRPLCMDMKCTRDLLEGKINELPKSETFWKLPSILSWDFFQKMKLIYQVQMGSTMMQMQQNLIDMAKGGFKSQTNTEYPNLLMTMYSFPNSEKTTAKSLKGYLPDECLQSYIGTETSKL